jgi:hypothetical protein
MYIKHSKYEVRNQFLLHSLKLPALLNPAKVGLKLGQFCNLSVEDKMEYCQIRFIHRLIGLKLGFGTHRMLRI